MFLIKNATLFQEGKEYQRDVLIDDGKIAKIAEAIDGGCDKIDASGLFLLPGIIDLNVRLKENVLSKSHINRVKNKAKKSGVTTFALMPDFTPSIESDTFMELLEHKMDASMLLSLKGLQADDTNKLNNISTLLNSGAKIIQENSHINGNLLRRILQYALMKKVPFFCFCDNPDLNDNGVMHAGVTSSKLGLAGISKVSEISEVAKVAAMAEYYGAKTLFQSLSTARSLDIVSRAKYTNPSIYAEVSIFHLIFNDTACSHFNTLAKIYPPLRDECERKKLIGALKEGKIDVLTSLHASKSFNSKDVPFNDAAYGIDSLQDFLALCYTFLVKEGHIDMSQLIGLLSHNPAEILALENTGKIEEGYIADLTLFNPSVKMINSDKNSLLFGMEIFGEVKQTFKQGELL
ncbi:MAG TPA: dihydroorotase [Campylobacterales bacterium]|nr:dihydroorotase [Campylobacterales bacterium]